MSNTWPTPVASASRKRTGNVCPVESVERLWQENGCIEREVYFTVRPSYYHRPHSRGAAAVSEAPPSLTKWSAHEHACHIYSRHGLPLRLELILSNPATYIKPMLPSADGEAGSLLNTDLEEPLDLYVRERARLLERLKELSEGDWQRTAKHEE